MSLQVVQCLSALTRRNISLFLSSLIARVKEVKVNFFTAINCHFWWYRITLADGNWFGNGGRYCNNLSTLYTCELPRCDKWSIKPKSRDAKIAAVDYERLNCDFAFFLLCPLVLSSRQPLTLICNSRNLWRREVLRRHLCLVARRIALARNLWGRLLKDV